MISSATGRMARILGTVFRAKGTAPVTCAEAGRGGYIVRHDRERAKIRETTIAPAEKIGRPDLAERLR